MVAISPSGLVGRRIWRVLSAEFSMNSADVCLVNMSLSCCGLCCKLRSQWVTVLMGRQIQPYMLAGVW